MLAKVSLINFLKKAMIKTPVEWILSILEGQKNEPFNYEEWLIAISHAMEMEKEFLEKLKDFDTWKEWKNEPIKTNQDEDSN